MDVFRPDFPSPVICIDGFLAAKDSARVLQECIQRKDSFVPATIRDRRYGLRMDTSFRSNKVFYLKNVDGGSERRTESVDILRAKIWSEECKRLWHEGEYIFDIINYSNFQSGTISRYGAGDFYKRHRDTAYDHLTSRLVTIVLYVNREPEKFTGGRLVLFKGSCELTINPRHNRAVVFPSFTVHQVEPVCMDVPDAEWGDGRFSLNYWIGFQ